MSNDANCRGAKAEASRKALCVYCGIREAKTQDHVPPACLFPTPRPDDLITVPACRICNGTFGRDDEYFHQCLMTAENLETAPAAEEPRLRARRGLARPQARRFLESIVQSFQEIDVYSPGGIYLGKQPALRVDRRRVFAVIRRIAQGLYFTVNKIVVPHGYSVRCFWNQYAFPEAVQRLPAHLPARWPQPVFVGGNVFSYTFLQLDGPRGPQGLWLMSFYERVCAGAYVREKPDVE